MRSAWLASSLMTAFSLASAHEEALLAGRGAQIRQDERLSVYVERVLALDDRETWNRDVAFEGMPAGEVVATTGPRMSASGPLRDVRAWLSRSRDTMRLATGRVYPDLEYVDEERASWSSDPESIRDFTEIAVVVYFPRDDRLISPVALWSGAPGSSSDETIYGGWGATGNASVFGGTDYDFPDLPPVEARSISGMEMCEAIDSLDPRDSLRLALRFIQ